ncbi:hypothetical protein RB595_001029 [Gaeumannomyces hyphopodioides]
MADTYDLEYDYHSDGSDERYEDLDAFDSDDELRFELHESFGNPAQAGQGGLRSYETKKDGTAIYYAERPSDYSILADRILWVDGYESTTADGQRGREMTLIVLKIKLFSADRDSKFKKFIAELSFKNKEAGSGDEPFVEAWAPFRTPGEWNPVAVQREVTDKTEGGVKVGYQGAEVSGARSHEEKLSWTQVDFDQGISGETIGKSGRRNGVQWAVSQNNVSGMGVTPEVWAAVLLSRTTAEPYGVRFRLRSHGGTLREVQEGAKRFFGVKPDETKPFSVTPWKRTICHSEGHRIREVIDLDNLGKLIGPLGTDLILPLGPGHRIAPPQVSSNPAAEGFASALGESVVPRPAETATPQGSSAAEPQPTQRLAEGPSPSTLAHSAASPGTRWHIPADPARLAAMECRVAQSEARIATLESTMLELREALLDIRIKTQRPSI